MEKIWQVVPALDHPDFDVVVDLVKKIDTHPLIYGYKIGFTLGLRYGLPAVGRALKRYTSKALIYDHQKAGTDIPDTGQLFAHIMADSGMDEVILFPQAGPETEKKWITALQDQRLTVIIGGYMTHPAYRVSEGGFLTDEGVITIYQLAHAMGVRHFVVPLTKPEQTHHIIRKAKLSPDAVFYSPGFGKQGGEARSFPFINHHRLIIGRSLLGADDPWQYLQQVQQQLTTL